MKEFNLYDALMQTLSVPQAIGKSVFNQARGLASIPERAIETASRTAAQPESLENADMAPFMETALAVAGTPKPVGPGTGVGSGILRPNFQNKASRAPGPLEPKGQVIPEEVFNSMSEKRYAALARAERQGAGVADEAAHSKALVEGSAQPSNLKGFDEQLWKASGEAIAENFPKLNPASRQFAEKQVQAYEAFTGQKIPVETAQKGVQSQGRRIGKGGIDPKTDQALGQLEKLFKEYSKSNPNAPDFP